MLKRITLGNYVAGAPKVTEVMTIGYMLCLNAP